MGKARLLGVVLVGMLLSFSTAAADEYPSRPITLIVQFSAGTTDGYYRPQSRGRGRQEPGPADRLHQ